MNRLPSTYNPSAPANSSADPLAKEREPEIILIGVDHHSAPLEVREKVAYNAVEAVDLLHQLVATPEIAEACLLSTCNRTELYLRAALDAAPDPRAYRTGFALGFLRRAPEIEDEGRFYVKRNREAARHLFQVASGLESMVLGEPEILGQVKQAANLAEQAGTLGKVLQRLLRTAIAASGRARQETAIAAGSVSFGYAVVDLARNIFQRLETCTVLLIGAGETSRLVARNLLERGVSKLLLTNRSPDRAAEFCQLFPTVRVIPFAERQQALGESDVIVASTAASEPVLDRTMLANAMAGRRARPLLVVDLGVPRNIDPRVGELANLFLQDIDSLEDLIARNLKRRREEIPCVQEILDHELELFAAWCRTLAAAPLVAELQRQAEQIRQQALLEARHRFPAETHEDLEQLTRALVRKLLHHPSLHLRQGEQFDAKTLDLVRQLFQLPKDES